MYLHHVGILLHFLTLHHRYLRHQVAHYRRNPRRRNMRNRIPSPRPHPHLPPAAGLYLRHRIRVHEDFE